jgi:DNA-nicking Smr family endonuclease
MTRQIPIEDALDLHAFAPRDIKSVVEEYVNAAWEQGLREVRLIHGRGRGVQRGIVQQALERHPLVVEFWDAPETHLGATVARLRDTGPVSPKLIGPPREGGPVSPKR